MEERTRDPATGRTSHVHERRQDNGAPFEHTFLWIIDADDPHLVEEFTLETGLSSFNNLRTVPLKTLADGVIPRVTAVHGL